MPLPEKMQQSIESAISREGLLDPALATRVVSDMDKGKKVQWNLILNKQLELEKGGGNEADD